MERASDVITIEQLLSLFIDIDFPEYQREPDVWTRDQKQRLVDSILRDFDIAPIYFYVRDNGAVECIDGRQRINAIMSFVGKNPLDIRDDSFPLKLGNEIGDNLPTGYERFGGRTYQEIENAEGDESELAEKLLKAFLGYGITVIYLAESSKPDEFNLQFLRLNLGTLLNAGEKLHAMVGTMRDAIFDSDGLGSHAFFASVSMPTRRFARELTAAQIALEVFERSGDPPQFARARHLDLQRFLKSQASLPLPDQRLDDLVAVLDELQIHLEGVVPFLKNRAVVLSVVVLAWELRLQEPANSSALNQFAAFLGEFLGRLRYQVGQMKAFEVDDRYPYLVDFQRNLTQASVERPAIEQRHAVLLDQFRSWIEAGELVGDDRFRVENDGADPPKDKISS